MILALALALTLSYSGNIFCLAWFEKESYLPHFACLATVVHDNFFLVDWLSVLLRPYYGAGVRIGCLASENVNSFGLTDISYCVRVFECSRVFVCVCMRVCFICRLRAERSFVEYVSHQKGIFFKLFMPQQQLHDHRYKMYILCEAKERNACSVIVCSPASTPEWPNTNR